MSVLRALVLLAGVDLLVVLATGGYEIPLLGVQSIHPCTSLFVILTLELIRRGVAARFGRTSTRLRDSDAFLVLLIWAFYLSSFRWRGSGDVVAASLQPFSLLLSGDLHLDEYLTRFLDDPLTGRYLRDGHVLSKYPSAAGVLLVPFYLVTVVAGVEPTDLLLHQLQKLGASCMVALSAWCLLRALARLVRREWAVLLTVAYALGTASLSTSSQAIWQHGPSQLFICIGLLAWLDPLAPGSAGAPPRARWGVDLACGAAFAMAIWCRYTNGVVYAAVALDLASRRRARLGAFLIGSILPLAALAADNVLHAGTPFATGYGDEAGEFITPLGEGLPGVLFSPGRGLFLYSPFLLAAVVGFAAAWRDARYAAWRWLSLACAGVTVMYAKWWAWGGGWCFGPRMLADITPILVLGIVPVVAAMDRRPLARRLFVAAVAVSVLIHAVGASLTWWWEATENVWSWRNHPLSYLLCGTPPGESDQLAARWGVAVILSGIAAWFAISTVRASRRRLSAGAPPARSS